MQEIWKSLKGIVEYGDYYEVSNLGRVLSIDRRVNSRNGKRLVKGQILKQQIDKYGYCRVHCHLDGKGRNYQVHRLVALSFIPNLESKPQVNHKDGNKQNNRIDNLEWVTNKENVNHAYSIGLKEGVKGEDNINAILTEEDVINIYNLYKTNKYSTTELANMFDISPTNVFNIVSRNAWKHLDIGEPIIRDTSESLLSRDDSLVKNIISMYKNKLSLRKISENTGVSRTTVKDILESNGFKIEPNYIKLSDEDKCKIKELYETGLYNKTELANMFNVSRPTIRKIVAKD